MNLEVLYSSYLNAIKSEGFIETKMILCASIMSQRLYLMQKGKTVKEYTMSSSSKPPSCVENSLGTPWGLHQVCEKIGDGEEIGMVFVGRRPTGNTYFTCDKERQLFHRDIFDLYHYLISINASSLQTIHNHIPL